MQAIPVTVLLLILLSSQLAKVDIAGPGFLNFHISQGCRLATIRKADRRAQTLSVDRAFHALPKATRYATITFDEAIAKNLQVGLTPVIISNSIEWLSLDDWQSERSSLLHKLLDAYTEQKQWRRAVETLGIPLGVAVILASWVLTAVYVAGSNRQFSLRQVRVVSFVKKLNLAVNQLLKDPAVVQRLRELAFRVVARDN